jgi:signal transduction histidine kinase
MQASVEPSAEWLTAEIVRTLPVTMASVALWDQPNFGLTVKAVSTVRPLPETPAVGDRIPLSSASWHRMAFERKEPVYLEHPSPDRAAPADPSVRYGGADLRAMYLIPMLVDDETVGILTLGEMRSLEREPFTEGKRLHCLEVLGHFLQTFAPVWEAARLRRQAESLSFVVQAAWEMLHVTSYQELAACLGTRAADWVGVPVRAIVLRAVGGRDMEVSGRWPPSDSDDSELGVPDDAALLLLAMTRTERVRQGPIAVARVADDPLDPLHSAARMGRSCTRLCLPLFRDGHLGGIAFLYVEADLYPSAAERSALRSLADLAGTWMGTVAVLDAQERERRWLRLATWVLTTVHPRAVLREALAGAAELVAARLRARLVEGEAATPGSSPDRSAWQHMAEVTEREVTTVLNELADAAGEAGILPRPVEVNELVGWAIEIARARLAAENGKPAAQVDLQFEPTGEALMIEGSVLLLGALVHAIENAIEAGPPAGQVRVHTHRENGRVLISVSDEGPGVAEENRQLAFTPLFSTKGRPHLGLGLSVVRTLVMRHGGLAELTPRVTGGTTLTLSLPGAALGSPSAQWNAG